MTKSSPKKPTIEIPRLISRQNVRRPAALVQPEGRALYEPPTLDIDEILDAFPEPKPSGPAHKTVLHPELAPSFLASITEHQEPLNLTRTESEIPPLKQEGDTDDSYTPFPFTRDNICPVPTISESHLRQLRTLPFDVEPLSPVSEESQFSFVLEPQPLISRESTSISAAPDDAELRVWEPDSKPYDENEPVPDTIKLPLSSFSMPLLQPEDEYSGRYKPPIEHLERIRDRLTRQIVITTEQDSSSEIPSAGQTYSVTETISLYHSTSEMSSMPFVAAPTQVEMSETRVFHVVYEDPIVTGRSPLSGDFDGIPATSPAPWQSGFDTARKDSKTNALPQQTLLVTEALTKSYTKGRIKIPVLKGVNFSVAAGEFVSIVGQSGSGKSTLLHLLGTLDKPDSGSISINGKRVDSLPAAKRDRLRNQSIGFIFQFYHLLPELTTLENVLSPLMIQESVFGYLFRIGQYRARAKEYLDRVGLSHRLHHKPSELSGGEMQRAAIARALITNPSILLADEPTGNLDATTAAEIIELLRQLNVEQNLTILMVTHDMKTASAAHRAIKMIDGVIVEQE